MTGKIKRSNALAIAKRIHKQQTRLEKNGNTLKRLRNRQAQVQRLQNECKKNLIDLEKKKSNINPQRFHEIVKEIQNPSEDELTVKRFLEESKRARRYEEEMNLLPERINEKQLYISDAREKLEGLEDDRTPEVDRQLALERGEAVISFQD